MLKLPTLRAPVYDRTLRCYRWQLTCGRDLLIDVQDFWLVPLLNWKADKRSSHVAAAAIFHRLIMRAFPGRQVDHRDLNRLHNYKSNLRLCTNAQNCQGRGKHKGCRGRKTSSRFKGVCWYQYKWYVFIKIGGSVKNFGAYADEEQAARKYDQIALQLFGEFARTNADLGLYDEKPTAPPVPPDAVSVILRGGEEMLIDEEDAWVFGASSWRKHPRRGYADSRVMIHRLIMRAKPEQDVEHRNTNPLDNRRCNLRFCTQKQNSRNRGKFSSYGGRQHSSRFKGVSWAKPYGTPITGRWECYIIVNRRRIRIGRFRDETDAARAYDAAAKKHFGTFARTNADLNLY